MRASPSLVAVVLLVACGDNNVKSEVPDAAPVICGNGIVEPGEDCDDDDALKDNVCDATCHFTCGNGVVDSDVGELCDTGIASGSGACPSSCDDGVACTDDALSGSECTAECVHASITAPADGDGCCPAGADASTDDDCTSVCGNGVVEPGEQCDDANTNNTDACANDCTSNAVPTAFRFSDLDVRDPHVHVSVLSCNDLTDNNLFGFSVNGALQTAVQTDDDKNGLLDLSPTLVFRPFSQAGATMPVEVHFARCTAPLGSTSCSPGATPPTLATATNMTTGTCLGTVPGTVHPYSPAVTATTAPCFVTSPITVTISVGGIPITLRDAQVAAHYVGNPATLMTSGLLRGFISEADANATIIPASFPVVGGKPLSSLLAGGSGACPAFSDKDTNNGIAGWWFYMSFPATRVSWTD